MMTPTMLYTEIENTIRQNGSATFNIGESAITFDLSHRHERYYAASLLMNIRYPQGDIDQALFRRFIRKGDQVLDAGANIGVTALELIDAGARRVIAVEPIPELFARLARLPNDRIVPVANAISSETGVATITVSLAHNQGSSLKSEVLTLFPYIFGDEHKTLSVETTTIDLLRSDHGAFDVWKLDIEGAEVDALSGAADTLRHSPPRTIIAELFGELRYAFADKLKETHPYGARAFLRNDDYQLDFAGVDAEPTALHHHTSPMFVFSQQPIV